MSNHSPESDAAPDSIAAIERDIARTRAELGRTVDQLTAALDVRAHARNAVADAKDRASELAASSKDAATDLVGSARTAAADNRRIVAGVGAGIVVTAIALGVGLRRRG